MEGIPEYWVIILFGVIYVVFICKYIKERREWHRNQDDVWCKKSEGWWINQRQQRYKTSFRLSPSAPDSRALPRAFFVPFSVSLHIKLSRKSGRCSRSCGGEETCTAIITMPWIRIKHICFLTNWKNCSVNMIWAKSIRFYPDFAQNYESLGEI